MSGKEVVSRGGREKARYVNYAVRYFVVRSRSQKEVPHPRAIYLNEGFRRPLCFGSA